MTTLAERLLQALQARGATEAFGIPGDFALPLFREFERFGTLPLYTLSHEPAVGLQPTWPRAAGAGWALRR